MPEQFLLASLVVVLALMVLQNLISAIVVVVYEWRYQPAHLKPSKGDRIAFVLLSLLIYPILSALGYARELEDRYGD